MSGPYLCVMPACGPDCCGCNHAISPAQAKHNAVRYEWLRSIGREQLEVVMHYAGPALDAAIDRELAKLAKASGHDEWLTEKE